MPQLQEITEVSESGSFETLSPSPGKTIILNQYYQKFPVLTATTNTTVLRTQTGAIFLAANAAAEVDFTLPKAESGLEFTFINTVAQTLKVIPNSGDIIRIGADATNYQTNGTQWNSVTLIAISSTRWQSISSVGSWTAS